MESVPVVAAGDSPAWLQRQIRHFLPASRKSESKAAGGSPATTQAKALRFYGRTGCYWQFCFLPRAESTTDVDDILKTGSLQKAARDDAPVTALAMNRQRN